ncbi:hypothetical protein LZ554_007875 [Drepanopeziza brunnea f. sp. 'monogermtubi']|nr:hypothetical protein LZ554_007875 [Drepanopeziza brunnea f. sp. 'monogermtubi']
MATTLIDISPKLQGPISAGSSHWTHNAKDIVTASASGVTAPVSVFAPKKQNPTAHLVILRNPKECYRRHTPAFSPALGNGSDTYTRHIAKKLWSLHEAACVQDLIPLISDRIEREEKLKQHRIARRQFSKFEDKFAKWVVYLPALERHLIKQVHEQQFWRSWGETKVIITGEDGTKRERWMVNDNADQLGQMLNERMEKDGYNLWDKQTLVKKVEVLERMVLHREWWSKSQGATRRDNLATENAKSLTANTITHSELAATTQTSQTTSEPTVSLRKTDMEELPKQILRNIAQDEAILELSQALTKDLTERQIAYSHAANANMNKAFYALEPRRLHSRCDWLVRPMAMTTKNLQPPPAGEIPAIRLTLDNGVTCELFERFRDFSHPDWEEEWQVRADAQAGMEHDLKLRKRVEEMEIRKLAFYQEGDYETDSDSDEDDNEGYWDSDMDSPFDKTQPSASSGSNDTGCSTLIPHNDTPTKLAIAKAKLAEYNTVLANNLTIVKAECLLKMKLFSGILPTPKTEDEIKREKARAQAQYYQDLAINLVKLQLRISDEGMTATDNRRLRFTSSAPTGAGEVQFVGPLARLNDASEPENLKVRTAFKILTGHKSFNALRTTDHFQAAKRLLAPVTNPEHTKHGIFREEIRAAVKMAETTDGEVSGYIRNAIGAADNSVFIKRCEHVGESEVVSWYMRLGRQARAVWNVERRWYRV